METFREIIRMNGIPVIQQQSRIFDKFAKNMKRYSFVLNQIVFGNEITAFLIRPSYEMGNTAEQEWFDTSE